MGVRETKLPSIPEPTQDNFLAVIRAIKEVIEVGILPISRGDPLDSNVTYRNLYDIYANGEASGGGSGNLPTPPTGPGPGPESPFPPPVVVPPNLPGRPTNVSTSAVWDGIMVRWDWPTEANTHWERASIHASSTDNFDDGTVVGFSASNLFIHTGIGLSGDAGDGDTTAPGVRYYWVRFEASDPVTNELIATEWSPYKYEPGVYGQTSVDIAFTIESFRLGSSAYPELEAISPFVTGTITVGYNEDGTPIEELAIGMNGNLLIDGTIVATMVQAHTISAKEILAESVWAGLISADRVISTQFATRPRESQDFRLEINGEGTSWESFPLWYGRGETGGDGGTFWFQNYNVLDGDELKRLTSMFLNGQLFVTGGGYFYGGNVTYDDNGNPEAVQRELRIEIGGAGSDFILWSGSGLTGVGDGTPESESQPIFFIDKFGNAVFTGTVDAKFVAGEISRTGIIYLDGPWTITNIPSKRYTKDHPLHEFAEEYWFVLGEWELPEPPFATGHIPHCEIGFLMYGLGQEAGATRLEYRTNRDNDWTGVHYSVHDISEYGGSRSITTVLPWERRGEGEAGKTWFRFSFSGYNGYGPTVNSLRGLLMGIR
jgi:hypothetical protein